MAQFKGTLTPHLYARGLRAHGAFPRWFAVVLLVIGIGGVIAGLPSRSGAAFASLSAFIALGVFALLYPALIVSRVFKTNALLRDGFSGTANEEAFTAESPNGVSRIVWEKFHRAAIRPDMVLLYVSARQFLVLPKVFFATDSDWTEFQTIVRQRVRLRSRAGTFLRTALLCFVVIACVYLLSALATAPHP